LFTDSSLSLLQSPWLHVLSSTPMPPTPAKNQHGSQYLRRRSLVPPAMTSLGTRQCRPALVYLPAVSPQRSNLRRVCYLFSCFSSLKSALEKENLDAAQKRIQDMEKEILKMRKKVGQLEGQPQGNLYIIYILLVANLAHSSGTRRRS
jgi:hypothetical protein